MKKQVLSFSVIALFGLLALASTVNKMHYGAFNYNNLVEDKKERKNYVELNDGTKVFGDQISWKSGLLLKDQIRIDDQKFKMSEVRGYRQGLTYFGRLNGVFIKRIV